MKKLITVLTTCLVVSIYTSSASAAVTFFGGEFCGVGFLVPPNSRPIGPFQYTCNLGTMPLSIGYNTVFGIFNAPATHKVECHMEIRSIRGTVLARPIPQGYSSNTLTFWPTGSTRVIALQYSWLPDQYVNSSAVFNCTEEADAVNPRTLTFYGFYLLR